MMKAAGLQGLGARSGAMPSSLAAPMPAPAMLHPAAAAPSRAHSGRGAEQRARPDVVVASLTRRPEEMKQLIKSFDQDDTDSFGPGGATSMRPAYVAAVCGARSVPLAGAAELPAQRCKLPGFCRRTCAAVATLPIHGLEPLARRWWQTLPDAVPHCGGCSRRAVGAAWQG